MNSSGIKEIIHQKVKVMSLFSHLHCCITCLTLFLLQNAKEDILSFFFQLFLFQTALNPIDFFVWKRHQDILPNIFFCVVVLE